MGNRQWGGGQGTANRGPGASPGIPRSRRRVNMYRPVARTRAPDLPGSAGRSGFRAWPVTLSPTSRQSPRGQGHTSRPPAGHFPDLPSAAALCSRPTTSSASQGADQSCEPVPLRRHISVSHGPHTRGRSRPLLDNAPAQVALRASKSGFLFFPGDNCRYSGRLQVPTCGHAWPNRAMETLGTGPARRGRSPGR